MLEEKLEARFPGKFQLVCYPDAEETGRFEVTLFKSLYDLNLKTNGLEAHSKAETKRLPSFDENNTFMQIMKKFWILIVIDDSCSSDSFFNLINRKRYYLKIKSVYNN